MSSPSYRVSDRDPLLEAFRIAPRRTRWRSIALRIGVPVVVVLAVSGGIVAYSLWARSSATGPPPPPDLNPARDRVGAVYAQVAYAGTTSGYLSVAETGNLCSRCPLVLPTDLNVTPPRAGFFVYLNVTNIGTEYHTIDNFTIAITGASAGATFTVLGSFCCAPGYAEQTDAVGLVPGLAMGLSVYLYAIGLPTTVAATYTLELTLVSSS